MSRLNNFVVNIQALTKAVTQRGFGLALILDGESDNPYTIYGSISAVADDYDESTDVYKLASRVFGQSPSPVEIAIAGTDVISSEDKGTELVSKLNDIVDLNDEWFALMCTDNDTDVIQALSNWIDTQHKVYAVTTQDLGAFELLESENTFIGYHDDKHAYLAEGLLTVMLLKTIGGATAKFKAVQGVLEADITDTKLAELHKNNGFTYIRDHGVLQSTEGKVSDGEYLDVVLGKYFLKFRMEEELVGLALNTDKIAYSNEGISLMVDRVKTVLKMGVRQDIILTNDEGQGEFEINILPRQDVPKNDIANRTYNYLDWTATLSGAIHDATISGKLVL